LPCCCCSNTHGTRSWPLASREQPPSGIYTTTWDSSQFGRDVGLVALHGLRPPPLRGLSPVSATIPSVNRRRFMGDKPRNKNAWPAIAFAAATRQSLPPTGRLPQNHSCWPWKRRLAHDQPRISSSIASCACHSPRASNHRSSSATARRGPDGASSAEYLGGSRSGIMWYTHAASHGTVRSARCRHRLAHRLRVRRLRPASFCRRCRLVPPPDRKSTR